jgi:3-deoxy-D-manno-octulosonate 8-phosphate phosphatase (KDO 8-P phosphatase)
MSSAAAQIKLLCLDVDGVLTDGSILIDDHGVETKRFHVRDGSGIRMWLNLGLHIALITGRSGNVVKHRAKELGITHIIQGSKDKCADCHGILKTLGYDMSHTAMLGDDLPDLPLLKAVAYPMAVADASPEVKQRAAFTTLLPGGRGAVREAIEHLLKAQNRWDEAMRLFC